MSHTLEKELREEEVGWGDMREMEGVAKRKIVKLRVRRKANPGKKQKEKTGQEKNVQEVEEGERFQFRLQQKYSLEPYG